MPVYRTSFAVNATPNRVWDVLTALDEYGEWNPQIPFAKGAIAPGHQIAIRLALPGRPTMELTATIGEAMPSSLLSWRGHVLAPWLFEGYREFALEPSGDTRTMVTHIEDIRGALAPVFALLMGGPVERSHHELNQALRSRAEAKPAASSSGA